MHRRAEVTRLKTIFTAVHLLAERYTRSSQIQITDRLDRFSDVILQPCTEAPAKIGIINLYHSNVGRAVEFNRKVASSRWIEPRKGYASQDR